MTRRTAMLSAGGVGVFGVLTTRLYFLQVIKAQDYRSLSEDNRFNYKITLPSRGVIRDRYGSEIAVNKQNYRVLIVPEQVQDLDESLSKIANLIELSEAQKERVKSDVSRHASFIPIVVDGFLSWEEFTRVNLRLPDLPGIIPDVGEKRYYPAGEEFSHILGFVGRANSKDLEQDNDPMLLQPTFYIGKTGVEATKDKELRGSSGELKVEVNARGRVVREFPNADNVAKQGGDVWLTIDRDLQKKAAELFGDESGGAVVMDVHTGEVLTLLSMPGFDNNLFVSGLTQADMDALNADVKRPQFNKVIGGGYPPASTFKMVVMLAGLEYGIISPDDVVHCNSKYALGNRVFHCWKRTNGGHGFMNMRSALKESCDIYFYDIIQRVGMERVKVIAENLGFGQKFDLGISGQTSGIVPDDAWKRNRLNEAWRTGDSLNASIGQGFVLATPLQLTTMAARIANGVSAVSPHLIIQDEAPKFSSLEFKPENLALVKDAMRAVTEEVGGTAFSRFSLGLRGLEMAGKTGTGQVRGISTSERESRIRNNRELPWKLRDHSIFVGFAPYDDPRYSVGVVVEHGGSGAVKAPRIARGILRAALQKDGLIPADKADG
ncbi:MAG: penicillin-binding protein 2 [Maricaulaceae bacterium]